MSLILAPLPMCRCFPTVTLEAYHWHAGTARVVCEDRGLGCSPPGDSRLFLWTLALHWHYVGPMVPAPLGSTEKGAPLGTGLAKQLLFPAGVGRIQDCILGTGELCGDSV